MTRRLVLLRHAKSAYPTGVADHDRPLAGRGRREAPLAGDWLDGHVTDIDVVLCSSAVRAQQTWALVAERLTARPATRVEPRLYGAPVSVMLRLLRELPDEVGTALVVGHNPDLEDLVGALTDAWCPMKTSSIAVLESGRPWAEAGAGWAALAAAETPR